MTKIFLTGATGYIGGDFLATLRKSHPEFEVISLIRSETQKAPIQSQLPGVHVVVGDLDNSDLIEKHSREADIVVNLATSNHIKSVQAIRTIPSWSGDLDNISGTLVQISGGSILSYAEIQSGAYGESSDLVLDDVRDISTIRKLTKEHPKRVVDGYLLSLASERVKTAIVCPPCIYGNGEGPVHQRSMQIPDLANATLRESHGLVPGAGLSRWSTVNIRDLSTLFVKLVEHAAANNFQNGAWGADGYYLPINGEKSWGDIAKLITQSAYDQGFNKTLDLVTADKKKADEITPSGSVLYGINARFGSTRAQKFLGWSPVEESVEASIAAAIEQEAADLGIKPNQKKNSALNVEKL
ncbi:nucleoside-diphosphate-sugar epimerase [Phlyctema vagabunda]|uniref:Nucleoside-diphosphate-sugar epimerase n=1 Tax=Phlyctema vagabunda TaxID=108571 RepID=A0ABR4PFT0_9HELO